MSVRLVSGGAAICIHNCFEMSCHFYSSLIQLLSRREPGLPFAPYLDPKEEEGQTNQLIDAFHSHTLLVYCMALGSCGNHFCHVLWAMECVFYFISCRPTCSFWQSTINYQIRLHDISF